MIDMGKHKGTQIWYTGGRSLAELIQDGEIAAVPDSEVGIAFKRVDNCTPLELEAQFTLEELRAIKAAQDAEDKANGQDA